MNNNNINQEFYNNLTQDTNAYLKLVKEPVVIRYETTNNEKQSAKCEFGYTTKQSLMAHLAMMEAQLLSTISEDEKEQFEYFKQLAGVVRTKTNRYIKSSNPF